MPNSNQTVIFELAHKYLITARALRDSIGDCRILDCRFDLGDPAAGRKAYAGMHIPGAVYVDLDRDLSAPVTADSGRHPLPAADRAARRFGELGVDGGSDVVVYDQNSGAYAARAWWMLRWLGHGSVQLLDGGLDAWLREGFPVRSGTASNAPGRLVARPRDEWILTTGELAGDPAGIAARNLFDARDAARFRGESEPIDSVAGHIPGARNLPLTKSLDEDQTWKSRGDLERLWARHLDIGETSNWAVMCGSGVTACHLALSGLEAGLPEPRVYVGSWSEWIRDPGRPVALGAAG